MKIPVFISLLLFSSLLSLAQVERKPSPSKQTDSVVHDPGRNKMDRSEKKELLKELDLTKEQKIKLKEIRQENKSKKEMIENDNQLSETEKKSRLHTLQKEQAQKIQAILTDEQKEKLKAMRQEAMKEKNQ
jgi:Spy/CpxP family protein refolding chaperone